MLIRIIAGVFLIYLGGFLFREYYKLYKRRNINTDESSS